MGTLHILPVPSRRLFSKAKAALYLGLSKNTLIKYTDEGRIRACDLNGNRRYKLEDLDAFIESLKPYVSDPDSAVLAKMPAHQTRVGRSNK